MAPIHVLAPISWLLMLLAGNEAQFQSMKLMTRSSDAAALCALDEPTVNADLSSEIPGAPEVVCCAMTCTSYGGCKHFNYVSTESKPCQLYNYRPTNFDVSPNCQHYYQPGQLNACYCRYFYIVDLHVTRNVIYWLISSQWPNPIWNHSVLSR